MNTIKIIIISFILVISQLLHNCLKIREMESIRIKDWIEFDFFIYSSPCLWRDKKSGKTAVAFSFFKDYKEEGILIKIDAYWLDGTRVNNFPIKLWNSKVEFPIYQFSSVDVNDDNIDELIIADDRGRFYALDHNCKLVDGYPKEQDFYKNRRLWPTKMVHIDGLFPEASLAAVKAAKKAGVPVSVDAGSLREGMLELCAYSDFYIASSTFAEKLVGANRPIEACYKLAEYGPQVVGVTMGERGYVVLYNRKIIKKPAYRVKAVDTTGCGDAFHGAFAAGVSAGMDWQELLTYSSATGALCCTKKGGRLGMPTNEEVLKLIKKKNI